MLAFPHPTENLFKHIDIDPNNTHLLDGNAKDPKAECEAYEQKIKDAGGIELFLGGKCCVLGNSELDLMSDVCAYGACVVESCTSCLWRAFRCICALATGSATRMTHAQNWHACTRTHNLRVLFSLPPPLSSGMGNDGHVAFNEPCSSLASRTRMKTLTTDTIIANARFFDNDINKVPKMVWTLERFSPPHGLLAHMRLDLHVTRALGLSCPIHQSWKFTPAPSPGGGAEHARALPLLRDQSLISPPLPSPSQHNRR